MMKVSKYLLMLIAGFVLSLSVTQVALGAQSTVTLNVTSSDASKYPTIQATQTCLRKWCGSPACLSRHDDHTYNTNQATIVKGGTTTITLDECQKHPDHEFYCSYRGPVTEMKIQVYDAGGKLHACKTISVSDSIDQADNRVFYTFKSKNPIPVNIENGVCTVLIDSIENITTTPWHKIRYDNCF